MNDSFLFGLKVVGLFLGLFAFVMIIMIPVMYIDGKGKAAYLRQTQGIELEWYEAIAIDVNSGSAKAQITIEK